MRLGSKGNTTWHYCCGVYMETDLLLHANVYRNKEVWFEKHAN